MKNKKSIRKVIGIVIAIVIFTAFSVSAANNFNFSLVAGGASLFTSPIQKQTLGTVNWNVTTTGPSAWGSGGSNTVYFRTYLYNPVTLVSTKASDTMYFTGANQYGSHAYYSGYVGLYSNIRLASSMDGSSTLPGMTITGYWNP